MILYHDVIAVGEQIRISILGFYALHVKDTTVNAAYVCLTIYATVNKMSITLASEQNSYGIVVKICRKGKGRYPLDSRC